MNANFMRIKALVEEAEDIGVGEEKWFVDTVRRLLASWNESLYQRTADILLNSHNQPLLDNTFRFPSSQDELEGVDGIFKIATIADTGIEFGVNPPQIQMHSLLAGSTGYGKSTLIKVLCQQVLSKSGIRVWLVDPKGQGGDFRFLARDFGALVLRPDTIRCNPFTRIPHVPVDMHREAVTEVTADSWGVFDAGEGVLLQHIHAIFEQHEQPTMFDLFESLQSENVGRYGRRQGYIDTIDTRTTKAQISNRDIINCKADYFYRLYDESVVFEIGELSGSAQRVLVPWIVMKLVLYKIKNPTPKLSHILVFDEAQANIWSRHLELRGRSSFMADLATQARAFGLGIIVLSQDPCQKLMASIISNSCVKVCFYIGSGIEISGMAAHLGLTHDQMEKIHHLKRGEAVCRVGLDYTEPMLLKIHNFPDINITNDQLADIMKPQWDKLLEGIEPVYTDPDRSIISLTQKPKPRTVPKREVEVQASQGSSHEAPSAERLRTSASERGEVGADGESALSSEALS